MGGWCPVPTPTQARHAPLGAVGSGFLWVWRPLESPRLIQREGLGQGVCWGALRSQTLWGVGGAGPVTPSRVGGL